jgi:hypothetical protein
MVHWQKIDAVLFHCLYHLIQRQEPIQYFKQITSILFGNWICKKSELKASKLKGDTLLRKSIKLSSYRTSQKDWKFQCLISVLWPPLWSSGQSSWLQIRRPGFDSRYYQKKKVVGLERGPLSLVSTIQQILDRKVAASGLKTENTAVGIRHTDRVAPFIRKGWQSLRWKAAVARSVQFARGLRPRSLFVFCFV